MSLSESHAHAAPLDPVDPKDQRTWQQRKSAQTRERVLQATIDCIYDFGYTLTSTDKVAARAKLSRGAMLHHFPTRKDLIVAAVRFLNASRLQDFLKAEEPIQKSGQRSRIGAGIDVYWNQLASPQFVVFQELQVLSRTDKELREALDAALTDFDTAWRATVERLFPDLIESSAHELANLITMYLCEGMALYRAQRMSNQSADMALRTPADKTPSEKMVLDALKDFLRASYSDVRDVQADAGPAKSAGARKNRQS